MEITTKFDIAQNVFLVWNKIELREATVANITIDKRGLRYGLNPLFGGFKSEGELFESAEEAKQAIRYALEAELKTY
jgi:hypothetical protein